MSARDGGGSTGWARLSARSNLRSLQGTLQLYGECMCWATGAARMLASAFGRFDRRLPRRNDTPASYLNFQPPPHTSVGINAFSDVAFGSSAQAPDVIILKCKLFRGGYFKAYSSFTLRYPKYELNRHGLLYSM